MNMLLISLLIAVFAVVVFTLGFATAKIPPQQPEWVTGAIVALVLLTAALSIAIDHGIRQAWLLDSGHVIVNLAEVPK